MATARRIPGAFTRFMRTNKGAINMTAAGGYAGAAGGAYLGFGVGMASTWVRNRFHSKDKHSLWKGGAKGALIGGGLGGSVGGSMMASRGISEKMASGRRF